VEFLTRKILGLAAAATLLASCGCDSDGGGRPTSSTSKNEVTVTGTVSVAGKPASGGNITFDASNIERKDVLPKSATIGKDGKYTVKTYPGDNGVLITITGQPMQYRQRHEVSDGDNTYDIELESAQSPKGK